MKVCFLGLGSIGKKHLLNLQKICTEKKIETEIHAYRSKKIKVELAGLNKQIFVKENLDNDYDVVFITNPTSLHYETIKLMSSKTKHMFIEKPVFDTISYSVENLKLNKGIYYVAAPLRHTGIIEKLVELLDNSQVYSVRSICSSYLPDWRPDTDYRKNYSAKKELGGGVSIDLIHEWDYLTYLFNFPIKIYNLQGKFSHLEISSEDLSVYIAEYNDKIIELHLDYFGRRPKREMEIYTNKNVIIADFINKNIQIETKDNVKTINLSNMEDFYLREMRYFIEMITLGGKNINTVEHAYQVLKLIKEAKQ